MYLSFDKNKLADECGNHNDLYLNPIFKDAQSGKLKKLKKILENSPDLLKITDAFKDTLLHHAALGNAFKVVAYLDILNSGLNLPNAVGQTPFFSACQSGSFEAAATLLYRCKDINEKSKINLTPIHLACKSRNASLVTMLILCGSKLDIPDSDGSLPLHYAAQRGGPNMCSLLLRFYPNAIEYQNSKRNSPLHIACANSNMVSASTILKAALNPSFIYFKISDFGSLATVLTKREYEVTLLNKDGQTPELVAGSLGHFELASMLQYELYEAGKDVTYSTKPGLFSLLSYPICGYPGRRRAMFFWMIAISFGWLYPYLFFRISSSSVALSYNETTVFICLNLFLWTSFFVEVCKNPGYLPTNTVEYEEEMRELFAECRRLRNRTPLLSVDSIAGESQKEILPLEVKALRRSIRVLKRRLNSLCHTCGCVKPIRAKHCSLCNRCVHVMDHHCPVTDNCVGQDNRVWFLFTSISVSIVSIWIGWLIIKYWFYSPSTSFWEISTLFLLSIGCAFALNAFIMTIMSAVFNLTTNELANWRRYEYFGNAKTGFKNPFNKGCWSNIVEFFCPHYYVTERELFRKRGAVDKEYPFVV